MYICNMWLHFRCRPVEAATSSLTNEQLTEHYADCIKLSTQDVNMYMYLYVYVRMCACFCIKYVSQSRATVFVCVCSCRK